MSSIQSNDSMVKNLMESKDYNSVTNLAGLYVSLLNDASSGQQNNTNMTEAEKQEMHDAQVKRMEVRV